MKRYLILSFIILSFTLSFAQKKPLDHSVYDAWQSIGERLISNNGKWVVYTINTQEGDNDLVVQSSDATYKKTISRGYSAVITEDDRYVIFKIKPFFKSTRDARIKKKRPEELPKDSFAIIELGKDSIFRIPRIKTFKVPEKAAGWVAYHLERPLEQEKKVAETGNRKVVDSLKKTIDSLMLLVKQKVPPTNKDDEYNDDQQFSISDIPADADEDGATSLASNEGTDLILRNLETGEEKIFKNVGEYYFNKTGKTLLLKATRSAKDSLSKAFILYYDLKRGIGDTLSRGGNDFKNFALSEDGLQVAYLAERESMPKDLQKFYRVWYYKTGLDSAVLLADKNSPGMKLGMTVSENGIVSFSKSGKRLFFGTAPIEPPKDTTLIDIDLVKLDIWHYNDDYLQTQQLYNLQNELKRTYLAIYHLDKGTIKQLGSREIPTIIQTNEGDGETFIGASDFGKRIEFQWNDATNNDIYAINAETGEKRIIKKDLNGRVFPSSTGKYILWYDNKARNYFTWDGDSIRNITKKIKQPLYNEEFDMPDDPNAYGIMRWRENDDAVYIYDRYDIWQVDPSGRDNPVNITAGQGRKTKTAYRYMQTDPEERSIKPTQTLLLRTFNQTNKQSGIAQYKLMSKMLPASLINGTYSLPAVTKAERSDVFLYTKETYVQSPDVYLNTNWQNEIKLSSINPQQQNYNWGTTELFTWKTFNGKVSTGILYKPENFDSSKKYPLILYFYEKLSDGLYNYIPPSPTGSRLNISFYVSRGYLVMTPDISYTTGHPAKDAYNYIVSGAQDLAKKKWVDAKNIGIQGQSWGGIQVAQLVTMTDMFKAAWAGAPVANMTSAYSGIRWESGRSRQFQYEKTQSRIGATLWEKPQLYIENSPLFHVPNIKTPLVIMANDADGAVPWYQGIELFSGMRRLGKKVWMLTYNGEGHNLRERRNQKDIQIREQQYFDWLLKGAKPPKWIVEGVPAVKKGKDWGLEIVD